MTRKGKREIQHELEELESEAEGEKPTLADLWAEDVSDGIGADVTTDEWEAALQNQ